MVEIRRTGEAEWQGNLKEGSGTLGTGSGVLKDQPYGFRTRFESAPGTNPEELIAAAHAACYSMAFSHTLAAKGYGPESVRTRATCVLSPQEGGGFRITAMRLEVRGRVPGLGQDEFAEIAREADEACPVSNALRGGMKIELDAKLA